MKTIHKVTVDPSAGVYDIALGGFVRWLDAGCQEGQLVAWAEVDTELPSTGGRLAVEWTGQPSVRFRGGQWRFLRSVKVFGLMCHLFAAEAPDA